MDLLTYFDDYAGRYAAYKGGRWCYEDGLLYLGLVRLHQATGQDRWLDHLTRMINRQIAPDGTIETYDLTEFNIDNILSGRSLFYLSEMTGDTRYDIAADQMWEQLQSHPRTQAGNYWHKKRYPWQVWLDGLYMGLPFQVEYAQRHGNTEAVDDAFRQLHKALEVTTGPAGLYVHGFDESRQQSWANDKTGQSPAVWARAVGWMAMALVDLIELAPDHRHAPVAQLKALLAAVDADKTANGLWRQVMNMPDLTGNYEETSASAMFAYAYIRADQLGLGQYAAIGERALAELQDTYLKPVDGHVQLTQMCHVAGLGGFDGVYRDGTPEYYLTETVCADDIKGVSPFITAIAASLTKTVAPA